MDVCREGALELSDDGNPGYRRIENDDESCTGCGDCAAFCPNDALAASG